MPVDLRCSDLTAVVTDYLEAALTADEAIDVEQHLLICDGCLAVVERMRTTIGLLSGLPRRALSTGARAMLLASVVPADRSS
ncbi:MAG TPA: zf-HC2 domain-containing protein [Candidatus Dormibacteraeota bacterium]|nr:zf-HC2 domain-containing protein [Candidatus Dormibacteraeota bacterium]